MSDLKPYPEYKERTADWVGNIPIHWEMLPSKALFTLRRESEHPNDAHLTPSQKYGVMSQQDYMQLTGAKVVLTLVGSTKMKHVEVDDFIIHLRSFQGGIEWAGVGGKVSPAYTVLNPANRASPGYYRFVLKSRGYVERIASLTDQLRDGQSMNYADFGKSSLICPPHDEQRAIASFLDHETAEIDAFIADQEELVRLLNERRAATITQAVTKGLDPNVPMKDSGVEWLGEVPAQWGVSRLKNSIQSARNGMWGNEPQDGLDLRCVRVADFNRSRLTIHDDDRTMRSYTPSEQSGRVLLRGDLLLEKSGGGEKSPVGFVVRYDRDEPALCSNFVARITLLEEMDSNFWTYVHSSMYSVRLTQRSVKQSTGIQNLDQGNYLNEQVAFPPPLEQIQIAGYLDRETSEIDATIADAKEAIALSKERRAALISAAVTGKIDVREHPAAKGAA